MIRMNLVSRQMMLEQAMDAGFVTLATVLFNHLSRERDESGNRVIERRQGEREVALWGQS